MFLVGNSSENAMLNVKLFLGLKLTKITPQGIYILINTESPCILAYKPYLIYAFLYVKRVTNLFMTEYNVSSLFDNYLDAIKPRIIYVHFIEPRSSCHKI